MNTKNKNSHIDFNSLIHTLVNTTFSMRQNEANFDNFIFQNSTVQKY